MFFSNPAPWVPGPCPHGSICPIPQSSARKAIDTILNGSKTVASSLLRSEQDYSGSPGRDSDLSRTTQLAGMAFTSWKAHLCARQGAWSWAGTISPNSYRAQEVKVIPILQMRRLKLGEVNAVFRSLGFSLSLLLPFWLCVAGLTAVILVPFTACWNNAHCSFLSHCCLDCRPPPWTWALVVLFLWMKKVIRAP